MFNYDRIKQLATSALDELFRNGPTTTVVYKKLVDSSFDPSAGANVKTYEEYEITVIRSDTALEIRGASSVLKAIGFNTGEKLYIVQYDELPRNPLDQTILKDLIVENGVEMKIKKAIPVFDILVYLQV